MKERRLIPSSHRIEVAAASAYRLNVCRSYGGESASASGLRKLSIAPISLNDELATSVDGRGYLPRKQSTMDRKRDGTRPEHGEVILARRGRLAQVA
jgi:hypothetical protein